MEVEAIFPEVIDSTLRNDFVSCPQKFWLSRILGLAPKGGSVHLIAGGAFAKGIEVTRRRFYEEGINEHDAIADGVLAAWAEYDSFDPGDRYQNKSADRVGYALVEYFCEYPLKTDRVQPYRRADGKTAQEFEFTFPLETKHPVTGNPLLYGGRFDMVGQYMSGLWVVDEKTATRLGPSWLKSFTLRGQLVGYCYAAQQFDLPVSGFIVRGISFLKDYYGHAEVIEPVPSHRIERWREQVEIDARNMVRSWEREEWGWSFGDACNSYGGCPFQTLCTKEEPSDWYDSAFEVSRWTPITGEVIRPDQPILDFSS